MSSGNIFTNTFYGTNQDDTLLGSIIDDCIFGLEGSDALFGQLGDDNLIGGIGDDTLTGGDGDDTLNGGDGIDLVKESADKDFIVHNDKLIGLGTDLLIDIEGLHLIGGASDNHIDASAVDSFGVTVEGGLGNDTIKGAMKSDVYGEEGDDKLYMWDEDSYFTEDQLLDGGAGNDTLYGRSKNSGYFPGRSSMFGGSGEDLIIGGGYIDAGEDNDLVYASGYYVIRGGDGHDTIHAISKDDSGIHGDNGNDHIFVTAQGGGTAATGGTGDDILTEISSPANHNDSSFSGGFGNDTIRGGRELFGGNFDDNHSTINTIDTLIGTTGTNYFYLGNYSQRTQSNVRFYDDEDPWTLGLNDYALIQEFNEFEDEIVLAGSIHDYQLGTFSGPNNISGTGVYIKPGVSGVYGELITVIQDTYNLEINADYFSTIGINSSDK